MCCFFEESYIFRHELQVYKVREIQIVFENMPKGTRRMGRLKLK
jgi:hypothetical protein